MSLAKAHVPDLRVDGIAARKKNPDILPKPDNTEVFQKAIKNLVMTELENWRKSMPEGVNAVEAQGYADEYGLTGFTDFPTVYINDIEYAFGLDKTDQYSISIYVKEESMLVPYIHVYMHIYIHVHMLHGIYGIYGLYSNVELLIKNFIYIIIHI